MFGCTLELAAVHGDWNTSNKPFSNNMQKKSAGWPKNQYLFDYLPALFPKFPGPNICFRKSILKLLA